MSVSSKNEEGKSNASLFSINESAAQAFSSIADYLELKGENPFKIKAYLKASRVLRDLPEDLVIIGQRGELREIPGVGKAIAEKLESFLSTGVIPQLEALKEEIPSGLIEISSLPGLGAKKTILLHKELGISSLLDLRLACEEGKLETVKGFSKNSQAKFLALVTKQIATKVTYLKHRLEEWGKQIVERLCDLEGAVSVAVVGKVRRKMPQSEQLEVLLVSEDMSATRAALIQRLQDSGLLFQEEASCLVFDHLSGCPVRVHFCPPGTAGLETIRTTGPDAFVDVVEEKLATSSPVEAAAESALLSALGLPFVPPEIRHRKECWSATMSLLEVSQIRGNLHAHTTRSDGRHTLLEMVEEARRRGHSYFGVSDHSRSLVVARGLTEEQLGEQLAEVRELDAKLTDFTVFASNECDILENGQLDYPDDILAKLDYVVAAVHSFFHLSPEDMTHRLLAALSHPKIRIFAHPTGRLLTRRDGYAADWNRVFELCAAKNVAVEINSSPWRLDASEELLDLAVGKGCLIAVNTDAHSTSEFANLVHGVDMARRGVLDPDIVVNTWSAERLKSWFESGKR